MNEVGNECSQVKRRLNAGKPLTGDLLDFALGLVPHTRGDKYDEVFTSMTRKLKAGKPLGDYEHHLMVDVFLLHVRLQAAAAERSESDG